MRRLLFSLVAVMLLIALCAGCASQTASPAPSVKPTSAPTSAVPAPTSAAPVTSAAPAATTAVPAAYKPIEITYVTFLPRMQFSVQIVMEVLAEVEKKTGGQIVFKYRGGPEAIPPFDQIMAVKTGVVDMIFDPAGYNLGLVAAPAMINIAEIPAYEDRNTGAYDFMVELHNKVGLRYLARASSPPGEHFSIVTKKAVDKPQNMAGMRINGGAIWEPVAAALGMKTVAAEIGDIYLAMERGILDACGSASTTLQGLKIWDVSKYLINPPFFSDSTVLIMNSSKWDTIPKNLQTQIIDTIFEMQKSTWEPKNKTSNDAARKAMLDNKMENITFAGADAEWYLSSINKAVLGFYSQRAPEDGPKLYNLLKKSAIKK